MGESRQVEFQIIYKDTLPSEMGGEGNPIP